MSKQLARQLLHFIDASPSVYHTVENIGQQLAQNGYLRLYEQEAWQLTQGGKYFVVRGGSSVLAFQLPRQEVTTFAIAATHSDSPALKLRQNPEIANEAAGCVRLSVEPYGGPIYYSWLDRPLSVAGRVACAKAGTLHLRLVNVGRDVLVIPSTAIHLNRTVNEGVALKPNIDMLPLFAGGTEEGRFASLVAAAAGVPAEEIVSSELFLYTRAPGALLGADEEFVGSPRLDNLQCTYACLQGFLQAAPQQSTPVLCVFNNEEVGSNTFQGANSTFLQDVLQRICAGVGQGDAYHTVIAGSFMVSADNAHAVHPAHPEYADAVEAPRLNGGVVLKYNANQKYSTDAVSAAVFKQICRRAGVPFQQYSNRADMPGGSTLGNISSAQVSVPAVDIGLPQLAMHASYEVGGVKDTAALVKVMTEYFGSGVRVLPGCTIQV